MMYRCAKCDYSSTRRHDLRRHERRKISCVSKEYDNSHINSEIHSSQNIQANSQNIQANSQNIQANSQNIQANAYECQSCNKTFSSKYSFTRHLQICKGVDSKRCPICLKIFKTAKGKYEHRKNVNCKSSIQIIEENHNPLLIVNNTTTNVHNDHCTVNNNITIKFGEECLDKLIANPDYFKRMEDSLRLGKYAIPQHINDIFFNESFPMNNTIMKSRHNDRFVKIKTGEDKWDTRVVDDVYKSLINKMESYMHPYFSYMEKRMETIYDDDPRKFRRMTRSIREYGHKVLWLDWNCEDIRQIGVDLNDPYCETERQRRIQEMKSLLLEHIYDKTRQVLAIE